jgi:hypothetical protein
MHFVGSVVSGMNILVHSVAPARRRMMPKIAGCAFEMRPAGPALAF